MINLYSGGVWHVPFLWSLRLIAKIKTEPNFGALPAGFSNKYFMAIVSEEKCRMARHTTLSSSYGVLCFVFCWIEALSALLKVFYFLLYFIGPVVCWFCSYFLKPCRPSRTTAELWDGG